MTLEINGTMYGLSQLINMTDGEILDLVYQIQLSEDNNHVARVKTQTLLEWVKTGGFPNAMAN